MFDKTVAYGLDFIFPAGDDTVGGSLARHGEFARPEIDFLLSAASAPKGVFLDVGANIGALCLPFARVRSAWNVVAIEAHRGLAQVLAANAINNRLANVDVRHVAAGAERQLVAFPDPSFSISANWGTVGFHTSGPKADTVMATLDSLAPEETRLVKVDVEGFEVEVLKGARRLLADVRPTWLVEARSGDPLTAETISIFLAAGYDLYWFYAPFVTPGAPKRRKIESPFAGDANLVALPAGSPNTWNLPAIRSPQDERPARTQDYPYLSRYGYLPA